MPSGVAHNPAAMTNLRRTVLFATAIFIGAAAVPVGAQEDVSPVELADPPSRVTTSWGLGLGAGQQWYADEDEGNGDSGTVRTVQLTYRALLRQPDGGNWLFELGVENAVSVAEPETAPGVTQRVRMNGVFYRFSRFLGEHLYVGGRLGMSRVRGPADAGNLDLTVGFHGGWRFASWLDASVQLVAADPSGDPGGQPMNLQGVVTASF